MFVRLISVVVSLRRKFFHAELFPNYGILYSRIGPVVLDPAESAMPWVMPLKEIDIQSRQQ